MHLNGEDFHQMRQFRSTYVGMQDDKFIVTATRGQILTVVSKCRVQWKGVELQQLGWSGVCRAVSTPYWWLLGCF